MSVKAKSKKRLVILVSAVLGTGVAAGGLVAYKMHRTTTHFAQARATGFQSASTGDHLTSANHLGHYLDRHPDDLEALRLYAKEVLIADGLEYGQAVAAVSKVRHLVEMSPADIEPKRQLMRLQTRLQRSTETKEAADAVLAQDPRDAEALSIRVGVLMGLRQWDAARESAEKWCAVAPGDPVPQCQVLSLMARLEKPPEEIKARAKVVAEKDPASPLATLVTMHALAVTNDVGGAQAAGKVLAKMAMPTLEFAKAAIDELNGVGLIDDSFELLRRVAKDSDDPVIRQALARRLWETSRSAELIALTDDKLANASAEMIALRATAFSLLGKQKEAAETADALKSRKSDPTASAWSLIVAELQKAGSVKATELRDRCESASRSNPNSPYLYFFKGLAYSQLDEGDLAVEAWHRAAALSPTWVTPLVRSSEICLSRGRFGAALNDARAAYTRSGGHDGAVAINLVKVTVAAAEAGQQEPAAALTMIESIRAQVPKEEQTLTMHVSLLAYMGRRDEAISEIRKGLAFTPPLSSATLMRLANISQQRRLGVEDECLALYERAAGSTTEVAYTRAVQKFMAGSAKDGLAELRDARKKASNGSSVEWDVAEARYLELIEDPSAKDAWTKLADANPDDRRIQQVVLNVKSTRSDKALGDRTIERLRKLTGETSLGWRVARAKWRLQWAAGEQDLAETALFIKEITRSAPELIEPRVLLAQAYERLKKVPESIEQLQAAATIDPSNMKVAMALAQLLQNRKEFAKAQEVLDRVAKSKTSTPEQKRIAAGFLAQQGDTKQAIGLLEETKENSVMLAALYRQQNDLAKAEEVLKKVLAAKPDVAAVQFAADFYAQQGRRADADKALAMLDGLGLKPSVKEIMLAEHAARYQGEEAAEKWFKQAVKVAPASGVAWRAMAAFYATAGKSRELGDTLDAAAKSAASDAETQSVVAQKAALLSATANPDLRSIVAIFIGAPQPDSPALAAIKEVTEGAARKEDPGVTAANLKKIADQSPQFMAIQLLTSRAYLRVGKIDEAAEIATKAVQGFPNEVEPCRLAVQVFSAGERWSEALSYARTWRERSVSRPLDADMAITTLLLQLKQPAEAAEQIKPHVAEAMEHPDTMAPVIFQYVASMNIAGQVSKAADVVWPLAEKSPEWQKIWMQLALRCNDATAAEWLERVTKIIPNTSVDERAVLAGAWRMLAARTKNPEQLKTSAEIFDEIMTHKDLPATTIMARGIVAERDGDLKTAESAYRRALAIDSTLLVAKNNLAALLSKQGTALPEAVKLAKENVAANPDVATLYDTLGVIQAQMKDVNGGVASLRKALALEPKSIDWRVHLAQILFDNGNRKEAENLMVEVAALSSVNREPVSDETLGQISKLKADLAKGASAEAGH